MMLKQCLEMEVLKIVYPKLVSKAWKMVENLFVFSVKLFNLVYKTARKSPTQK